MSLRGKFFDPALRIGSDVTSFFIQIRFIPDHMLVIIALPDRKSRGPSEFVYSLGCGGLKTTDNRSDSLGGGSQCCSCGVQGRMQYAPTHANVKYCMEVIGHDDEVIERDIGSQVWGLRPFIGHYLSEFIQLNVFGGEISEEPDSVLHTNSDVV